MQIDYKDKYLVLVPFLTKSKIKTIDTSVSLYNHLCCYDNVSDQFQKCTITAHKPKRVINDQR